MGLTVMDQMSSRIGGERKGHAPKPFKPSSPGAATHRTGTDRSAFVTIVLLIISLGLMTFDVRSSNEGFGAGLRNGAKFVAAPLQAGINAVVSPVVGFADGLANLAGLRQENERLRERIAVLEGEIIRVGHLEAEVEELGLLLDLRLEDDLQELAVRAEVTGSAGILDPTLFINRGTADGVHPGQPVVDNQGALVGVILEALEGSSVVLPITSRRAPAVTVRLADDRRGIVEGLGADGLQLAILDADTPVDEGDLLITFGPYGDSHSYPKGLLVGTVTASASPRSGVIRVSVAPMSDLDRVEYLTVLPWPPSPDQLAEATEPVNPTGVVPPRSDPDSEQTGP